MSKSQSYREFLVEKLPGEAMLVKMLPFSKFGLVLSLCIALVVLAGWNNSNVAAFLPIGWDLMKANTALSIAISSGVLWLFLHASEKVPKSILVGAGLIILLLSGIAFVGHVFGSSHVFETVLFADAKSDLPGRMSRWTALFLIVLGMSIILLGLRRRFCRSILISPLPYLLVLVFLISSGYLFSAFRLYGDSADTLTSIHTLISMIFLSTALVTIEMRAGNFIEIMGSGSGSRLFRRILPWLVIVPPSGVYISTYWISGFGNEASTVSAVGGVLTSVILLVVTWHLARGINESEANIENVALTDDETSLHNGRAFRMLGEDVFREAGFCGRSLSVLFFSLENSELVADGSPCSTNCFMLRAFAETLRATWGEEETMIARTGIREFTVVSSKNKLTSDLPELLAILKKINKAHRCSFELKVSISKIHANPNHFKSFSELILLAKSKAEGVCDEGVVVDSNSTLQGATINT